MKKIRRILIANRGEIVNRIIRASNSMGIRPIVLYTADDLDLTYLDSPIEKYELSGTTLQETYLNKDQIISIAQTASADAIHPGYGFLSEDPEFAEQCIRSGLKWIGPSPAVMRIMSGKELARKLAIQIGVPVIQAIAGTPAEIIRQAAGMGFPMLIKAVAGGGGRGMRIIKGHEDFEEQIKLASAEAGKFFGNPAIFAERYIENARHIEVQILGDHAGNVVHLFERDCSIQRRYQKITEESPAPNLPEATRQALLGSAVKLAKAANYDSAGTIEFLVDRNGSHFFIEMNTRIQVEHPVTEMVTGIDLVREQIRIADGRSLSFSQDQVRTRGHAIECRICAEDYADHFHPAPGHIGLYLPPEGRGVRVEEAVRSGSEISSRFDSMISKLIVKAPTREAALEKMTKALNRYVIQGIKTNIPFQRELMSDPVFATATFTTGFIPEHSEAIVGRIRDSRQSVNRDHLGHIYQQASYRLYRGSPKKMQTDPWNGLRGWRHLSKRAIEIEGFTVWINGSDPVGVLEHSPGMLRFVLGSREQTAWYSVLPNDTMVLTWQGFNFQITDPSVTRRLGMQSTSEGVPEAPARNLVTAPLPGKVTRVLVSEGDQVLKGSALAVIESMKTENQIVASVAGTVGRISVSEGQQVKSNDPIMELIIN